MLDTIDLKDVTPSVEKVDYDNGIQISVQVGKNGSGMQRFVNWRMSCDQARQLRDQIDSNLD